MTGKRGDSTTRAGRRLTEMTTSEQICASMTHGFQAQDGLLHTAHVGDVVFVGAEFSLLDPFVNARHHLSGDVRTIIHT